MTDTNYKSQEPEERELDLEKPLIEENSISETIRVKQSDKKKQKCHINGCSKEYFSLYRLKIHLRVHVNNYKQFNI